MLYKCILFIALFIRVINVQKITKQFACKQHYKGTTTSRHVSIYTVTYNYSIIKAQQQADMSLYTG